MKLRFLIPSLSMMVILSTVHSRALESQTSDNTVTVNRIALHMKRAHVDRILQLDGLIPLSETTSTTTYTPGGAIVGVVAGPTVVYDSLNEVDEVFGISLRLGTKQIDFREPASALFEVLGAGSFERVRVELDNEYLVSPRFNLAIKLGIAGDERVIRHFRLCANRTRLYHRFIR